MTSGPRLRRASRSPTHSSNSPQLGSSRARSGVIFLPRSSDIRATLLLADGNADAVGFDTTELHCVRRLGEFKLHALADAVAACRTSRRDRFKPLALLHDIDPTFR